MKSNFLVAIAAVAVLCATSVAVGQDKVAATPARLATEPKFDIEKCRPSYPWRAADNLEEGMVEAGYLVGLDGAVLDSFIVTSSGIPNLDRAVLHSLRTCRLDPAKAASQSVIRWRYGLYIWRFDPPGTVAPAFLRKMERGNPMAHYLLALMYSEGYLVDKDEQAGRRWLRSAAERGVPMAQFKLGLAYEKGTGVDQDDQQAAFWYRKAAALRNTFAREKLHFGFGSIAAVPEPEN